MTVDQPGEIHPGDIYGDEIGGISLVDASWPRACAYLARRKAEFDVEMGEAPEVS